MRTGDRHGWSSLQNYLTVHNNCLDNYRAYFIVSDSLVYQFATPGLLTISGRVAFQHGLFLDVDKLLEVNNRHQVRTISYSYHAGVEGPQDRAIFRYDNAHQYVREGHEDAHHKHRFDPKSWNELEPPIWIGRNGWPHLSEVIEELIEWWDSTGKDLELDP